MAYGAAGVDDNVGRKPAMFADGDGAANDAAGLEHGAGADLGILANDDVGTDGDAIGKPSRGRHRGAGMDAGRDGLVRLGEKVQEHIEGLLDVVDAQQGGLGSAGKVLGNDDGGGLGLGQGVGIPFIGQEGDVARRGIVQGGQALDNGLGRTAKGGIEPGGQFGQRDCVSHG